MPSTMTFSALAQARGDDDVGVLVRAGLNGALFDLVLTVDDQHIVAGLVDLQGGLRNDHTRLLLPFPNHGGDEFAVDQLALGIGDRASHDQGVGLLVDL